VSHIIGGQAGARVTFEAAVRNWTSNAAEYLKSLLFRVAFGYGEKPLNVIVTSLVAILFYAWIYNWLGVLPLLISPEDLGKPITFDYSRFRAQAVLQFPELRTIREMFSGGPGFSHCFSLMICKQASIASSQMRRARSVPRIDTRVECCWP
jgi:hypothetical protein